MKIVRQTKTTTEAKPQQIIKKKKILQLKKPEHPATQQVAGPVPPVGWFSASLIKVIGRRQSLCLLASELGHDTVDMKVRDGDVMQILALVQGAQQIIETVEGKLTKLALHHYPNFELPLGSQWRKPKNAADHPAQKTDQPG